MIKDEEFTLAIHTLQQVKEKFCPREMLHLIEKTFKHVEAAAEMVSKSIDESSKDKSISEHSSKASTTEVVQLNADNMMPLTIFLLLRAAIPHLGTEILLLEGKINVLFELLY